MRFLGIELSKGVNRWHMLAYLFAVLVSSGYAGAMAVLQPGLLQVINIPVEEQGVITGMLGAIQEVIFIVLIGLYGLVSDKIGRRPVYVFGLLLTAIGFALYGQAQNLFDLVLYRILVAVGSAAMVGMMVTVVADYAINRYRGRANGVQAFVATLGAFIPPALVMLPKVFIASFAFNELQAQQATFGVAALIGIVAAVVAYYGLSRNVVQSEREQNKESMWTMLREGLRAAKDPSTALSYGAAFISRGDLAVTGAFMGLWFIQFGRIELGLTPSEAMSQIAAPRVFLVVSGAMLGSFLMGYLADKISRLMAVTFASGLAACVYLAMIFVGDPTAAWVLPLLFVMGIAEISAFVSSQALVGQQAPAERRGVVIGFFGVAGAIGIFVAMVGGGYLFSNMSPSAPFVLFGIFNVIVFIWSLWVRQRQPSDEAELAIEQV